MPHPFRLGEVAQQKRQLSALSRATKLRSHSLPTSSHLALYALEDSTLLGLFLWFYFCWGSWHIFNSSWGGCLSFPSQVCLENYHSGEEWAVQGSLRGIRVMWGVKCRFLSSAHWHFPGMRLDLHPTSHWTHLPDICLTGRGQCSPACSINLQCSFLQSTVWLAGVSRERCLWGIACSWGLTQTVPLAPSQHEAPDDGELGFLRGHPFSSERTVRGQVVETGWKARDWSRGYEGELCG